MPLSPKISQDSHVATMSGFSFMSSGDDAAEGEAEEEEVTSSFSFMSPGGGDDAGEGDVAAVAAAAPDSSVQQPSAAVAAAMAATPAPAAATPAPAATWTPQALATPGSASTSTVRKKKKNRVSVGVGRREQPGGMPAVPPAGMNGSSSSSAAAAAAGGAASAATPTNLGMHMLPEPETTDYKPTATIAEAASPPGGEDAPPTPSECATGSAQAT